MARGIGTKREIVLLRRTPQMIENYPGLNSRKPLLRIKFENLRHVSRKIEHHSDIATLPRKRSSSATAKHGRAVLAADGDRCDYFVDISRKHDTDRNLAVIRSIGRVKSTAAVIETNVAADMTAQGGFQSFRVRLKCSPFLHDDVSSAATITFRG